MVISEARAETPPPRLVVQVGIPHPKKSVSSVQIGQPIANDAASMGQSSGSRSAKDE